MEISSGVLRTFVVKAHRALEFKLEFECEPFLLRLNPLFGGSPLLQTWLKILFTLTWSVAMGYSRNLVALLARFSVSFLCIGVASAHAAGYTPGYLWNRSQQWSGGVTPGSSLGNPDDDSLGNPTWVHETTSGGGLNSANPWYAQTSEKMVWDNYWFGNGGQPVWAREYAGQESGPAQNLNVNPPISRWALTHDVSVDFHSWQYVPQVRWLNPVGDGALVDIFTYSGHPLTVEWTGGNGLSPNFDVEFAIAKFDASAGVYNLLYSQSLVNPAPGSQNPPFSQASISFRLNSVRFDSGDSLVYSLRIVGDGPNGLNWVNLYDHPLYMRLVSVVPEPSTSALMFCGLGVSALFVRRRRLGGRPGM